MDLNTAGMNEDQASQAIKHRKKVYEIIEKLSDTVEIGLLEASLPYLHTISWDEMVDERYLARVCGLPTCSENRPPPLQQKYRIDRRSKAIYEACSERDKFCGEKCFKGAVSIRSQLFEEPFWMSGEASYRMDRKFDVSALLKQEILPEHSNEKENKETKVIPKKSQKPVKSTPIARKTAEEEAKILERLRMKYSNVSVKKAIIIPPKPMDPETLKRCQKAERIDDFESSLVHQFESLKVAKKMATPESEDVKAAKKILESWISPSTKKMVREGARAATGEMEKIFMDFLAGKETTESVMLPDTDKFDVAERRRAILMKSLKPIFIDLESKLGVGQTRRGLLMRLVSTFQLTADNVADFTKKELKIVTFCLMRIICLLDYELNDELFPKGNPSPSFTDYLENSGISSSSMELLLNFTDSLLKNHTDA